MNQIAIYQSESGAVDVRLDGDTVWLSLQQMADLFGRDKSVISRHLRNVFNDGELERPAVVAKNATTATDGKTYQAEQSRIVTRVNEFRALCAELRLLLIAAHSTQGHLADALATG